MSAFLVPFFFLIHSLPDAPSPISDSPLNSESPRLSVSWTLILPLVFLSCVSVNRSGTWCDQAGVLGPVQAADLPF